jgi:hypothetical protein
MNGDKILSTLVQGDHFVAQHFRPVRYEFVEWMLFFRLEDAEDGSPSWEQIPCRKLTSDTFKICCIPCFAYGIALDDVVCANSDNLIMRIVARSDQKTFRLLFSKSVSQARRDELEKYLLDAGALLEHYSTRLLAVSVSSSHSSTVYEFLKFNLFDDSYHCESGE